MVDYIENSDRRVAGFCPMGCGQTLFAGSGGHITCSHAVCPNPAAVDEILNANHDCHVVRTDEFNYEIKHPLAERIKDTLFDCDLGQYLNGLAGSPQPAGFYRVRGSGTTWSWEFIEAC